MERGTILIADPDADALQRGEVALARAGYSVVSVTEGTSALRLATSLVPDALVTEILLPSLDGFHLARRIRAQPVTEHIGIVAVTGYDGADLHQRAAESGIDAVVRKACSTYDVVRAVHLTTHASRALTNNSAVLRAEVDVEIERCRDLKTRAHKVLAESRLVAADIARMLHDVDGKRIEDEIGLQGSGARDVMMVDRLRGEQLFETLFERYGDHPLLRYRRGEAYRAIGRRKLAHHEFVAAAERFPEGEWRQRAQLAAMRTRSHHERSSRRNKE